MAHRAASIEYEIVPRPAELRAEFRAPDGASLQFLAITAIDGFRLDAALWHSEAKASADTTLVIHVHGSGANYWKPPGDGLGAGLATGGRAMLAINTRQHDEHVATENFFEIRRDIEAAIHVGRALGYRRLVLQGHSLGSIQILFYAATNWDPDLKAVSLLGMVGNIAWKTRHILIQDEAQFRALCEEAMASLRRGTESALLPLPMGWFVGDKMPVTARHFLTYRREESSAADSCFWISRVKLPILMVRNEADGIIQPFEPYMLLSAAHADGSLVESIRYVSLPDPRPRSPEGHSFVGNSEALVATIAGWLDGMGL